MLEAAPLLSVLVAVEQEQAASAEEGLEDVGIVPSGLELVRTEGEQSA